jgi:hypothetical protein
MHARSSRSPGEGISLCAVLALALSAAGCQGIIEGSSAPPGSVSPTDTSPPELAPVSTPDGSCQVQTLDPGIRRLNHAEYAGTLQALFGSAGSVVDSFPPDGAVGGYKTVGEGLTFSDALLDGYWATASELMASPGRSTFACQTGEADESCVRRVLGDFALGAWRRPLLETELVPLSAVVSAGRTAGDSLDVAVGTALRAMLMSPHFVFRLPPDPAQPAARSYAVAARLSYALWNRPPDSALLEAAAANKLLQPNERQVQVQRMLADAKIEGFAREFAAQWLDLEKLTGLTKDAEKYPSFSTLAPAMAEESALFFRSFLVGSRPVRDLLDASDSFLNQSLAEHYGIEGVQGSEMRPVALAGKRLGGILGQGSFLSGTSGPSQTAPVKRGHFVLERLLCTPPPPPPPGADVVGDQVDRQASKRVQLAQHRQNPTCAVCHQQMDPIGLAFDNYGATGEWREQDDFGHPVDASGELPGYGSFSGPAELLQLIKNSERLTTCLTQQLLTYTLGRRLTGDDSCAIEKLDSASAQQGGDLKAYLSQVVLSDSFLASTIGN